nr:immunoglobulin light chain junction region [Macaca mulatta]MPN81033.1 immunoglobulin light chain junction region [Macaca mulatta]
CSSDVGRNTNYIF